MGKTKQQEPAVLAENPEVALVKRESREMIDFHAKFDAFLIQAAGLEQRAHETLSLAKQLPAPTDEASDTAVKDFVRLARTDLKDVETHWGVCALFARFHKRLTTARGRATVALETAMAIATKLHTDYVAAEQRRVREEAERQRRAEEARAAEERRKDLEALEQQALEREADSPDVSAREREFVAVYVRNGGRGEAAAQHAGYKDAFRQAARLLLQPKIVAAIKALQEAEAIRQQKDALASVPLDTRDVVVESKADTAGDRGTKSAEVLDESAFVKAVIDGRYGIPADCLTINKTQLNAYARSLGERINLWPGVRLAKKTTIV